MSTGVKAPMGNATGRSLKIAFILTLFTDLTSLAQERKLPKKKTSKSKVSHSAESQESLVKASGDDATLSGEALKFKIIATPPSTDPRPTLRFSDPADAPAGQVEPDYADDVPDDLGYKTYLGYPKHRLGAALDLMNLSSKWSYKGQDHKFTDSPVAVDVNYTLLVTPLWNIGLDYSHYATKIGDSAAGSRSVHASSQNFDEYYLKIRHCLLGSSGFFRHLCPGIDVGNDAYPILKFKGANNLYLGSLNDVTVGVNLH